mgnify:CR=1 FL=1
MSQRVLAGSLLAMVVARSALGTVVPQTLIDTQTSPSFTSVWVPPASYEASQTLWPMTITPKPGGATEGKISGVNPARLDFFGPGLGQYFVAVADIYGIARADFGVLRAYAYAGGGVSPRLWGPPFVIATNPYAGIGRCIMWPKFRDGFTPPATPGAPNTGDTQLLTVQLILDGSIGGTGSATWLIDLDIVSDTTPPQVAYSVRYHTTGCGGPCPFPLTTSPIDVVTKVGTPYLILGGVGITANASGSAASSGSGVQVTAIDALGTGKFFVKVKETNTGLVGLSGHDYGAAVPPGTIPVPTTTTLKLPPDTTTSTIASTTTLPGATTTTTLDGNTTTTTQPGDTEQCGNCLDDDGDGQIDAEDADCCDGSLGLALRRARIAPGHAGMAVRLNASLPGAASAKLDQTQGGLTVQLRDATRSVLCAHLGAFTRKRNGRTFTYQDGGGSVRGIRNASLRVGKRDLALALDGKAVVLDAVPAGSLQMTVAMADQSGNRCATAPASALRGVGKKGALRFP